MTGSAALRLAERNYLAEHGDQRLRARTYIQIINQIEEFLGPKYMEMTLAEFRHVSEVAIEICERQERELA